MSIQKNNKFCNLITGTIFCFLLTVPCWFLGKALPIVGAPVFAILLGICLSFLLQKESVKSKFIDKFAIKPGITFTSKKVLQYSIILMGFSMNFAAVMQVGKDSIVLIIGTISVALIVGYVTSKLLKIPGNTAILTTIGSSICGGSAIAATAPVIAAKDDEISSAISTIFLFNVIAALIFPSIGIWLGLSDTGFGLWAGTAVNDTSSVVATAATFSHIQGNDIALELATIVKLTRTLAIIPITFILAIYTSKKMARLAKEEGQDTDSTNNFNLKKIFPWFIVYFFIATIINSILPLPNVLTDSLVTASKFMIAMAMFAIGLNTNAKQMVKSGGKPILLGLICWIFIAITSLLIQTLMGTM